MECDDRLVAASGGANAGSPSEAKLFAQTLLAPNSVQQIHQPQAVCEQAEWLARISPDREHSLNSCAREGEATIEREELQWLAAISPRHERRLQHELLSEAEALVAQSRHDRLSAFLEIQEAKWDPSKHPRRGGPPNAGWFASTGGAGGSGGSPGARRSPSLLDRIDQRNSQIVKHTGVVTPGMIRARRLATDLESAVRLPGEVARAAAAGLSTGGKAVVNGFATAAKDVATLGLSPGQLELIGVTKEDRERGYDTAVSISTGSGQVLIAVGSGGVASALSKGGSVARAASGALIAYDAAGNAVGVVQGVYDAATNGVTIANGAQVAAGALGLGANVGAARGLKSSAPAKKAVIGATTDVDEYLARVPRKPTPTRTAANQYEIKHTGPYNYTVSGGGATFDIDGYRGSTILEAKHVGNPSASPFVPNSSIPDAIRTEILDKVRDELKRMRTIIESGSAPFESVEFVTNSTEAKAVFEAMLNELGVPGSVRLEY